MRSKFLSSGVLLAAICSTLFFSPRAEAQTTVFFDFFLADNAGMPANDYNGFFQWNVTAGTVDLVGGNVPGSDDPVTGRYVDLAGSSGDPGVFAQKVPTNYAAGVTYNLSFRYSNSGGAGNKATVTIGSKVFEVTAEATYPQFQQFSQNFTFEQATIAPLVFQDLGVGADNFGVGIDAVRITQIVEDTQFPLETLYGVTIQQELITFDSNDPMIITSNIPITGLVGQGAGETIRSFDFRPATGQIYLFTRSFQGDLLRLYTVNPATGVATQVGSDIANLGTNVFYGFDFNPVVDRIRLVNESDVNARLNPTDGTFVLDSPLVYNGDGPGPGADDPNFGTDPNIANAAYTNSFAGATTTTLFGIDTNLDILVRQEPPNNGKLNTVGPLGVDLSGRGGFDISAATTTAYATGIINVGLGQSTQLYRINLGNGAATLVGSFPFNMVVDAISAPPPPAPGSKFGNLSSRVGVGTADNVSIAGFIITGEEPKRVLIRGIGPSLAAANVPSPVADPLLELYDENDVLITTNDNWKETQEGEIRATNIPPPNDLESAIVRTLAPGMYTAVERSKDGTDNIGLVEVYDVNPGSRSQLQNISTRGFVGADDRVLIGGLIITGTSPVRVIVRALGPSMPNVNGTLADPTLELFDANGMSIGFNDNWEEGQAADLLKEELAPKDKKEAAILRDLLPSRYTAIVRGLNGTTGVGLVEFYRGSNPP